MCQAIKQVGSARKFKGREGKNNEAAELSLRGGTNEEASKAIIYYSIIHQCVVGKQT